MRNIFFGMFMVLLIITSCDKVVNIEHSSLDYNTEIIGDWIFENEEFEFTFSDDGTIVFSEKLENGLYGNSVTQNYTITENEISTFWSDVTDTKSEVVTMTFSYHAADNFSTIVISHLGVENFNGVELENIILDDFRWYKNK